MIISKGDFFEGEHSDLRNHIIQEIFRYLNLCERDGNVIPKILKTVKDYSYKHPDIKEDKDPLRIILENLNYYKLKGYIYSTKKECGDSFSEKI